MASGPGKELLPGRCLASWQESVSHNLRGLPPRYISVGSVVWQVGRPTWLPFPSTLIPTDYPIEGHPLYPSVEGVPARHVLERL